MDQHVDRVSLDGGTPVAYARSGAGPVLVHVPGWLSHLELGWALPGERRLLESLSTGRTLVRYDRPGTGLTGGAVPDDLPSREVEVLDALVDAVGGGPVDVLGSSLGAPLAVRWAATRPERVRRLVLYGGWAHGEAVADPRVRAHVLGLVEEHWGLGSDLLTDLFAPDAGPGVRAAVAGYQRAAADARTARRMLEAAYAVDVRDLLARVSAPTSVLHRADDRAAPLAQGRALADGIPGATLTVLPGRSHLPWVGDVDEVVRGVRRSLGLPDLRRTAAVRLTPRQQEVAGLVAQGLSNREIGERLVITERSVESHVERIRWRLGLRSRAQLAAWYVATTAG